MIFANNNDLDQLEGLELGDDAVVGALTTKDGILPFAYGITGARAARTACRIGVIVHLIGGCLDLAMMLTLTLLNAFALLTPANMFLYQIVWMVPGLLITEWTRSI